MKKPFPVPEAVIDGRCISYLLKGGTRKHIFIDKEAAANGTAPWLIYVPEDNLVYRASQWDSVPNGTWVPTSGRGHNNAPLLPEGPAFWVVTYSAIEVYV